jgi:hypothetical protein
MFRAAVAIPGSSERFRVRLTTPPSKRPRDIDMTNEEHRRWNLRTLLLMDRAGLVQLSWDEAPNRSDNEDATPHDVIVHLRSLDHLEASRWEASVTPMRDRILEPAASVLKQLRRLLNVRSTCIADVLKESYQSREFDIPVVLACGGCPGCRAENNPAYAGRLRSRHTPPSPWPPLPIGGALANFLEDQKSGLIFYSSGSGDGSAARLAELGTWLLAEGIVCITAPDSVLTACDSWFRSHRAALVFPGRFPPTGILARQPAAIIVAESAGTPSVEELWPHMISREEITILVVPSSSHEPGYRHRLLSEMWTKPKLTVPIWEDLYRE